MSDERLDNLPLKAAGHSVVCL